MNSLDKKYQDLLQDIIDNGVRKGDRTGTGTLSVFGRQIRHDMSEGFPLLTTKEVHFKSVVTELLWFLEGGTNVKQLVSQGNNIWVGDAFANFNKRDWYETGISTELTRKEFIEKIKIDDKFAKKWGELGPIYGAQWTDWNGVNQIHKLIKDLKENPNSRRMLVNAWNVSDLEKMVLPPCHYGFQVYTRQATREEKIVSPGKYEVISLMFNMRSVDSFLGLPFNIASYGLLLEILAKEVNMVPGELIGSLGDTHLYLNHIEQAKTQIAREPKELTKLLFKTHLKDFDSIIDIIRPQDFVLDDYQSHEKIIAPLSN